MFRRWILQFFSFLGRAISRFFVGGTVTTQRAQLLELPFQTTLGQLFGPLLIFALLWVPVSQHYPTSYGVTGSNVLGAALTLAVLFQSFINYRSGRLVGRLLALSGVLVAVGSGVGIVLAQFGDVSYTPFFLVVVSPLSWTVGQVGLYVPLVLFPVTQEAPTRPQVREARIWILSYLAFLVILIVGMAFLAIWAKANAHDDTLSLKVVFPPCFCGAACTIYFAFARNIRLRRADVASGMLVYRLMFPLIALSLLAYVVYVVAVVFPVFGFSFSSTVLYMVARFTLGGVTGPVAGFCYIALAGLAGLSFGTVAILNPAMQSRRVELPLVPMIGMIAATIGPVLLSLFVPIKTDLALVAGALLTGAASSAVTYSTIIQKCYQQRQRHFWVALPVSLLCVCAVVTCVLAVVLLYLPLDKVQENKLVAIAGAIVLSLGGGASPVSNFVSSAFRSENPLAWFRRAGVAFVAVAILAAVSCYLLATHVGHIGHRTHDWDDGTALGVVTQTSNALQIVIVCLLVCLITNRVRLSPAARLRTFRVSAQVRAILPFLHLQEQYNDAQVLIATAVFAGVAHIIVSGWYFWTVAFIGPAATGTLLALLIAQQVLIIGLMGVFLGIEKIIPTPEIQTD